MTTLAADKPRKYSDGANNIGEYPIIANDTIFEGAAVGDSGAGTARPLVALDAFLGFAEKKCANEGGAASALNARVRRHGIVQLPIAGLTLTNTTEKVYASDDDTFTLTSTGNSLIGVVVQFVSSGVGLVKFEALPLP